MGGIIIRGGKIFIAGAVMILLLNSLLIPAVYAAAAGEIMLDVRQVIVIDVMPSPQGETFTYLLSAKTPADPMPEGSGPAGYTFTITGSHESQIGSIAFSEAGVYTYELRCTKTAGADYTTDPQIYTIAVHVINDYTPISIVYLSDGVKASEIIFEHVYKSPPPDPERPVTSDPGNPVFWIILMVSCSAALLIIIWVSRKSNENKEELYDKIIRRN